jgi:hypothetical protein
MKMELTKARFSYVRLNAFELIRDGVGRKTFMLRGATETAAPTTLAT